MTLSERLTTIYISSDHAGYSLKEYIRSHFNRSGYSLVDMGTFSDERVDYPDFADKTCERVSSESGSLGLLICGSGQGMAMRANKYPQLRAALCWNEESTRLSRQHNNANVLCLGARFLSLDEGVRLLEVFLDSTFENGRHLQRVNKINLPIKD